VIAIEVLVGILQLFHHFGFDTMKSRLSHHLRWDLLPQTCVDTGWHILLESRFLLWNNYVLLDLGGFLGEIVFRLVEEDVDLLDGFQVKQLPFLVVLYHFDFYLE
jgi:hypothetical protein